MPTFDVCIRPDTCVHIVVEADDKEEAQEEAFTVFETEIKEHTTYVMQGEWFVDGVARIREENKDDDDDQTE